MITYSYKLTETGYIILKNGRIYIVQDTLPCSGGTMDSITAEQLAKLVVEKLKRGLMAVVTPDEELELSSGVVSDERIIEMVDSYYVAEMSARE